MSSSRFLSLVLFGACLGAGLVASARADNLDKQRAELAEIKRLLPPSPAFDRWLDKFGYLPPDFDALPTTPYPQDIMTIMRNGKPERVTAATWPERRKQLVALTEDWLLGHAPPPPGNVRAVIEARHTNDTCQVWTVRLEFGPEHAAKLHCWLWVPNTILHKPAPVFLSDNPTYAQFAGDLFREGRFVICVYNATDPVYKSDMTDESEAYNDLFGKYDWSEFLRRGWSASRAVDWLATLDFVDTNRIYIGGNSRSAKQAVTAAAFDQRFAGVVASSPGSGGSFPFRYCDQYYAEASIDRATQSTPYWISPKVRFFSGRENKMPADFHFLYALIAPRPIMMRTAIDDTVENTWAVEQMHQLLQPVWDLLGKPNNLCPRYSVGIHTPDPGTYTAANIFLRLASDGKDVRVPFHFKPLHPWNYEAWAATNPPTLNPATLPDRSISDPTLDGSGRAMSPAQWARVRNGIRAQINWLLGEGPAYVPAKAEIGVGETEAQATLLDRATPAAPQRTKCRFGNGLCGNFYYPSMEKPAGKLPVLIWLCPLHTSSGYTTHYHYVDTPQVVLSRAGFLVFAFDPIATAERQEERQTFYDQYPAWSLMGKMVLDARHAIDAVLANPDADPKQVYLVGYGMGGMVAALAGALDDRVAGVASVAGFTPFRTDTDDCGTGGIRRYSHLYGWLPRLGAFVGHENKVPVDFNEILAANAPHRMLVLAPTVNWHETHRDVQQAVDMAQKAYALTGSAGAIQMESPDQILRFNDDMQMRVVNWVKKE